MPFSACRGSDPYRAPVTDSRATDDLRRNTGDGDVRRYVVQHDAAGADLRAFADFDVADDFAAGRQQHAAADLRMAVARFLAGAAERDRMQDRDVVFDDGRFADHDAGCVIEHDSGTDARGRVDVDAERHADLILEKARERLAVAMPQPVRDAMRLQRVKSFEEQERRGDVVARRVARVRCEDVDFGGRQNRSVNRSSASSMTSRIIIVGSIGVSSRLAIRKLSAD